MACNQSVCCNRYAKNVKSFLKRLVLIGIIQLIGWFLYTSIEEGFLLTDCIFNRAKVEALAKSLQTKINETELKIKTYTELYSILEGKLTSRNFELYHGEFKKYFNVQEPKAEAVSVGEICTKWYLFTAITLTTVGYGNVVPKTATGKYLFFPFCLVGVPAMLFFLGFIGKMLSQIFSTIAIKTSYKIERTDNIKHKELKSFFVSFIFLWIWILLEGLYSHLRKGSKLTMIDAVYFFFVSFTTIGYGDITSPMKQLFFEFRLYVGLSLMSGVLNSFHAFYQKMKSGHINTRHSRCYCCKIHTEKADISSVEDTSIITNQHSNSEKGRFSALKDE